MPAASDGATPSGPVPASQATRAALRASVVATSLAGVVAVVVAFALRGGSGALGAQLGAVIAVAFFTAGQYAQVSMMLNSFGVQLDEGQTLDPELKGY